MAHNKMFLRCHPGFSDASAAAAIFFFLLVMLASGATLVSDEVEVLKEIAKTLGKTDWDFSVDPCSGQSNWRNDAALPEFANAVTCDCSFENNTTCHVSSIVLKSLSLPGTLPAELVKLPYLREFDVSRNCLSGNIPPIWGTMQLVNMSLYGNRISGIIPKELGNISTLVNLTLDFNQLSGPIPPELGNLTRLKKLTLTSNNWSGELPVTLAKLTALTMFRIGDCNLTGSIPNFIENWKSIQNLVIQGSGLSGPIPPGIASLTNLTDLRISDLSGNETAFPLFSNATNMTRLILRSCNIAGQLPDYLGSLAHLKVLDVSFNKISGQIPRNLDTSNTVFMYLTGNNIIGSIPDGMLNSRVYRDLSYNNFTPSNSESSSCQATNLNLFASSWKNNKSITFPCLRSFQCQQNWSSLHINCGGGEVKTGDTSYEDDSQPGGPSKFYQSGTNWGFSSTGHFMDNESLTYVLSNGSRFSGNDANNLYSEARLSPLSLTYYGFCLLNGNYMVKLHFAEIKITNDGTYRSLGRRIFDIHIQGKLIRKDFNIENNTIGGVNEPVVLNIPAVVSDSTLEIRFYWAGKGTTDIPDKGVYGPLISAISVDHVPSEHGLSVGAIVGIVLAVLFTVSLVLAILGWKFRMQPSQTTQQDVRGLDQQTGSFTLRQIKYATNNFDSSNIIGKGGFGSVYKGNLSDGTIIAVKQLSSKSTQGNREFLNEIGVISAVQHPNLVKLYGCCVEGDQLLLVYEYMENNSLGRALFGLEEHQLELDWPTRRKICVGIARGLAYLHGESRLKIVHRDIKASNVLLDKELNPKISDFGLARLHEDEDTHISTRVAGTFGYMAPEYAMRGYLTDKADVYSFGVVLLEIVSGKSNAGFKPKEEEEYLNLLDWAHLLKKEMKLMELVDSRLGPDVNENEIMLTIEIALLCTSISPAVRPSMSTVVSMLEGRVEDQKSILDGSAWSASVKEISDEQYLLSTFDESQPQSTSSDLPFTASSTSASDLYPISLETGFLDDES
ncbi:probable leucine-rich repeat receptor-like serine/threonine-protein kinase At3g14840 isoform X1 [Coffea arabica]|uniref:non-specific serine/threonine protein kinase n=1 Tax=Coffea arabica TaxID=13443 RepID=A0A6P6SF58_COFAR|nr:probable leucine-rich repeat receptor-like serine/threonine-protein kinase At3g14840 isoform X1 [Coffea arabica]